MNKAIMIDIETLGCSVNAPILSIGAVEFSVDEGIIKCYYDDSFIPEGAPEMDTVLWWMRPELSRARDSLSHSRNNSLVDALRSLSLFIGDLPVWGNGAAFDNAILAYWFHQHGLKWPYRQDRCFRTMKRVFPVEPPANPLPHEALQDAIAQADHLISICNRYGVKLK